MLSLPDFIAKQVVLVFSKKEYKLSIRNSNFLLKDEDEEVILQQSCYKVFSIWIVGSCQLSSGILQESKKFGISIFMFSYGFKLYGCWNNQAEGNFLLRRKQYLSLNTYYQASKIIENKIGSQLYMLKKKRNKNLYEKEAIKQLKSCVAHIAECNSEKSLLGIEGSASKVYFNSLFFEKDWKGRKPRSKMDTTNTLMDMGYSTLFNLIESFLNLYGFDTYQGVFHTCFYQRKSLVCDLVEPFRPIVDQAILKGYNLGQINEEHFQIRKGQTHINPKHLKHYSGMFLKALLENKEEMFLYVQGYYRFVISNGDKREFPVFVFKE
ncbi:MAG: type V CRISPR-associated endonuclease Cas1 [Flavobacteriales bacterium]|nr:type V CRISPR-associated endonuclease Cas1 [Flavobacteriales bacterium]